MRIQSLIVLIIGLMLAGVISGCSSKVNDANLTGSQEKVTLNCINNSVVILTIKIEKAELDWDDLNNEGSFSLTYDLNNDGCVIINGNFDLGGADVTEKIEVYQNNNLIHSYYYPFAYSLKLGKGIFGIKFIADLEGFSKTGSMTFFVKDKTPDYKIKYYLLNGKYDAEKDMSKYEIISFAEAEVTKN